jgi:hypothetical protein
MGFLDDLFLEEKQGKESEKRLLDCVEKVDVIQNPNSGVFANMMNDLGTYIDRVGPDEDKLRMMAYAYARRNAAAGLCAQGAWGQQEMDYQQNMFVSLQQTTGHTVEFQKQAAHQAFELMQSYDQRLSRALMSYIVTLMLSDSTKKAKDDGTFMTVDEVIELFSSIVESTK